MHSDKGLGVSPGAAYTEPVEKGLVMAAHFCEHAIPRVRIEVGQEGGWLGHELQN